MNSLIETIERFDPGHFDRRYDYLVKLSKEVKEMGFFPLQITQNDIECYWIRLESINGKRTIFAPEYLDDCNVIEVIKKVARHEER